MHFNCSREIYVLTYQFSHNEENTSNFPSCFVLGVRGSIHGLLTLVFGCSMFPIAHDTIFGFWNFLNFAQCSSLTLDVTVGNRAKMQWVVMHWHPVVRILVFGSRSVFYSFHWLKLSRVASTRCTHSIGALKQSSNSLSNCCNFRFVYFTVMS